jgi:glucose-1-phosphate cytidylyltransferase
MKVFILAGGLGSRISEETHDKPKPMVLIDGKPILWHVMCIYALQGLTDFVIGCGYKKEVIFDYVQNELKEEWSVKPIDTGEITLTGGRVARFLDMFPNEIFMVTYGDGLADVDLKALLAFHESHGKMATVTTVRPLSRFGVMDLDQTGQVQQFREKPQTDDYVNAGFFVFEPEVLNYLDEECVLEQAPLERLAAEGQLMAFRHEGFWQPMDTYREFTMLNEMWDSGNAPWKVWK